MELTDFDKELIVEKICESDIRCKRCSMYDGSREDRIDKKDVRGHCKADTYDGLCYAYCFQKIYEYIEQNNLWELMIKKHRLKRWFKTKDGDVK